MFIELRKIRKSFTDGSNRRRDVLRGLSLSIAKGEFVAVTGVSGSGKTTLLNILGTLMRPDSGEYTLDGENMLSPDLPLSEVRGRLIGFAFQDFRLLPQFTVMDNILLPLLARGSQVSSEAVDYARWLMGVVGIDSLRGQYPDSLSGGEKARAGLCRALIARPALLLADEPTGQLDGENGEAVVGLLGRMARTLGTTIVMVTHDERIASMADRTVRIDNR